MAKPAEMDYYKVLGLVPGASKEEVASAYRKRSMAVHPDRYKGDNPEAATAEFINLTTAKEVLLDDKARAAFEALSRARDAHRAKQETQHAGRKKMREELEEREQAAKRRRQEPSAEQLLRQQREAEADARRDLEHELERLRSSGRLDGDAKQRPEPAATAAAAATSSSSSSAVGAAATSEGVAAANLSLRWPPDQDFSTASLGALLEQLGAGTGLALAVVGHKAVLEMPAARAHRLMARAAELAERGVRASWIGPPPAAAAAPAAAPTALPPGWRECRAPDGRTYYYHTATRQTQWKPPVAGAVGVAAAAGGAGAHERLESVTMMRLRQASERQRMLQALAAEAE
jgi:DnaJ family protein C protein 17